MFVFLCKGPKTDDAIRKVIMRLSVYVFATNFQGGAKEQNIRQVEKKEFPLEKYLFPTSYKITIAMESLKWTVRSDWIGLNVIACGTGLE
jgi:hypothetical protein